MTRTCPRGRRAMPHVTDKELPLDAEAVRGKCCATSARLNLLQFAASPFRTEGLV
jgi:hypothetical protein